MRSKILSLIERVSALPGRSVLAGLGAISLGAAVTQAGTLVSQPLLDASVTTNYSNSTGTTNFVAMGSQTYFITGDSSGGTQNGKLWVTGGGSTTTSLVKDLGAVGAVAGLATNGTKLFFVANGTVWQSDGTTAGTAAVGGSYSNAQSGLIVIGSDAYFPADSGGTKFQIFKCNGSGNAVAATSFNNGSTFTQSNLTAVNGFLFFNFATASSGLTEVWRYNPSNGVTTQATSIGGILGGNTGSYAAFGSTLLFAASDNGDINSGNPARHWYKIESDLTGFTNLSPHGTGASASNIVQKVGSNYYFVLTDTVSGGTKGNQLYKSDGVTAQAATLYTDQDGTHNGNYIGAFAALGTKLIVNAAFAGTTGTEPGVIDTTDTTGSVTNLKDCFAGSSNGAPSNFVVVGSKVFFTATIATSTTALFATDGTSGGTIQLSDTNSSGTDAPIGAIRVGNFLYYRAQTASSPAANQRLPFNLVDVSITQGNGQSAGAGSAFATALKVNVKDTSGTNNVSGVAVTFVPPGSGAGGSFASSATVSTDSNGDATSPTFTANSTTGSYAVKVFLGAVDTGLAFNLTNSAGDTTAPTVASVVRLSPTSQTIGGSTTSVTFRVTYSEAVTNVTTSQFAVEAVSGNVVGSVTGVTGSGTTRDVSVSITSGSGEFRLKVVD